ncbi:sulfite reductase flavoprotein subunit alpha [Lampropedia aestuarii]|uniref:sulfite reductase flavoprotein subunit alpha n=1 Tax=Lampropedia aestuarii TaxID=2562762 RepID=UPI0024684601|nr:sulfite reductase flavoprotein subunit alpha [Lampropedia aestuarii]MDH5858268.1 sulfite reductase flavoprotein subunit alpha [Lampropedia aestuarii]
MSANAQRLHIAYGSESGNAQTLAQRLAQQPLWQGQVDPAIELNALSLTAWQQGDLLVIISSSFGDGEPPANAAFFLAQVLQSDDLTGLRYALFGLGDTGYPQFCGFTKQLDAALQARGAQAVIPRVDADTDYEDFFTQWTAGLEQLWLGHGDVAAHMLLRVEAYGEDKAFAAPIIARQCLSTLAPGGDATDCAAHHIRLDVRGSGMAWRAGDTLHVLAKNGRPLLDAIAQWLGQPQAVVALEAKELRLISKAVLRGVASATGHAGLKDLLKFSQRKQLEQYLYGADILDVLQDFASPEQVRLDDLLQWLSPRLPRAYSIASPASSDYLDLCIRAVHHQRNGRQRHGMATHWLLHTQEPVQVYCRSNPGFHLPKDPQVPLVLIGTGTGIAPLLGLLREMQMKGQRRKVCLIFGEKTSNHDFLYRDELLALQASGVIEHLWTAFSRDGGAKYYVQHAMADHGQELRDYLERNAHVYICGNKAHLEKAVAHAFNGLYVLATSDGESGCSAADEPCEMGDCWTSLQAQARIHLELY